MGNCNNVCDEHKRLKEEFESYQTFAETTMQMMTEKNIQLEKNLDALTNIVEISKYINSNVSDNNLIPMINDMIIGILGVTYSSIYLREGEQFIIKATNVKQKNSLLNENQYFHQLIDGKPFIMNCKEPLNEGGNKRYIHSLIGVPIFLREEFKGCIIVEHTLYDFFNYEHTKFISSIANQIGIALENNFLYNKVKEAAHKDPLLGIYNRKCFFDMLEVKIRKEPEKNFAIIMVDLDNFKKVNDVFGHQFGDEVLISTARLISENLCDEDRIARYGGEELVICMVNVENEEQIYNKVDEIREKISCNEICYRDMKNKVTASFGISYYPKDGIHIEKVLNIADTRLYKAKKDGKNRVVQNE